MDRCLSSPLFRGILAKALVAFWVVLMVNQERSKTILIAGLGSGFGFQIIEDLGYVARPKPKTKPKLAAVLQRPSTRFSGGLLHMPLCSCCISCSSLVISSDPAKEKTLGSGVFSLNEVARSYMELRFMRNRPLKLIFSRRTALCRPE